MNDKTFSCMFLVFLIFCGNIIPMMAQEVIIAVPAQNIFNKTEFTIVLPVMNTQNHSNWRAGGINPSIRAVSSPTYKHKTLPGIELPSSVLHWRLASIGGATPPFQRGDKWPNFKWFTTSNQTWYQPKIHGGSDYPSGSIDFIFKIPAIEFQTNKFYAGNYSMQIIQSYGRSGFYVIEFTPESFSTVINIPTSISWLNGQNSVYTEITSLEQYRTTSTRTITSLGDFEIGNTVEFKLFARAESNIQVIRNNDVRDAYNISFFKLGSNNPKINNLPLSTTWREQTTSTFIVENGNQNKFQLHLDISDNDFKRHFFRAGIYTFQLNLNAKSIDDNISAIWDIDYTLKVPPLSEITIPTSGTNITFQFNTASQYQNGQSRVIPNQLKVSNNEIYEVYIKSDTPFFKRNGIQSEISSSILNISLDGEGPMLPLSLSPQKIISNGTPVLDKKFNMKYTILPDDAQSLVSKEKSTYSINVIYSFTAL